MRLKLSGASQIDCRDFLESGGLIKYICESDSEVDCVLSWEEASLLAVKLHLLA